MSFTRGRRLKMLVSQQNMVSILQPTIDIVRDCDWSNKHFYANWTAQTFYIVSHSTRLFSYAAARTPLERTDFHNRFLKHMTEEKGHENLASTDLKSLGFELIDFPELPSTAALYQTQYYWINEVSAYSFFGYLIALEGLAATVGAEVRQLLSQTHAANTTKFIKVHSEEDLEHIEEVFQWLDKMPKDQVGFVNTNLKRCVHYYGSMLKEIALAAQAFKQVS